MMGVGDGEKLKKVIIRKAISETSMKSNYGILFSNDNKT